MRPRPSALPERSLQPRRTRWGVSGVGEQLSGIDRVKVVMLATEVTPNFNLALFGNDGLDLFLPQAAQHAGHSLARAGARKPRPTGALLRFETAHVFFPEQPAKNGVCIEREQFFLLQRGRQVCNACEGIVQLQA